jgi:hypothetical protein
MEKKLIKIIKTDKKSPDLLPPIDKLMLWSILFALLSVV